MLSEAQMAEAWRDYCRVTGDDCSLFEFTKMATRVASDDMHHRLRREVLVTIGSEDEPAEWKDDG